jgi:hypothetical protein
MASNSTQTNPNKRIHSQAVSIDDITSKLDTLQRDFTKLTNQLATLEHTLDIPKFTEQLHALEQQSDNATEEHLRSTDTLEDLSRTVHQLTLSLNNLSLNTTRSSESHRSTSAKQKQQLFTNTITQSINTARQTNTSLFQAPVITNYITDTITTLTLLKTNRTSNTPYVILWQAFLTYQTDPSLPEPLKSRTRKAFLNILLHASKDDDFKKILKRTDLFATAQRCYLFASLFPGAAWRDAFDPKQMKLFTNNEAQEFNFQFQPIDTVDTLLV